MDGVGFMTNRPLLLRHQRQGVTNCVRLMSSACARVWEIATMVSAGNILHQRNNLSGQQLCLHVSYLKDVERAILLIALPS